METADDDWNITLTSNRRVFEDEQKQRNLPERERER